jgi:cob(I)alamin adenosyltransferase
MPRLEKGRVQLYTGNGKGKTTAALGLALRAAGSGMKTVMIQFMKGQPCGELEAVKNLSGLITIEQFGGPEFYMAGRSNILEHYSLCRQGLARAGHIIGNSSCDILILDEAATAISQALMSVDDIKALTIRRPANMEIVITGRGATEELMELCDLVTEMNCVKHYFDAGTAARKGIES